MAFLPKSARERVELFHLLFLERFYPRLREPRLVTVKGGANLRFFHGSPRYSEDLDLDAHTIAPGTLARHVEAVLAAPSLLRALEPRGMSKRLRPPFDQDHDCGK